MEELFTKVVSSTHTKMGDFGKKFEKFLWSLVRLGQYCYLIENPGVWLD